MKKNKHLNNKYYNIQKKYSFMVVTFIKTLFIFLLTIFLLFPPGNSGAVGASAILYCLVVIILLIDFVLQKRKE